jgi:hypothetical protein
MGTGRTDPARVCQSHLRAIEGVLEMYLLDEGLDFSRLRARFGGSQVLFLDELLKQAKGLRSSSDTSRGDSRFGCPGWSKPRGLDLPYGLLPDGRPFCLRHGIVRGYQAPLSASVLNLAGKPITHKTWLGIRPVLLEEFRRFSARKQLTLMGVTDRVALERAMPVAPALFRKDLERLHANWCSVGFMCLLGWILIRTLRRGLVRTLLLMLVLCLGYAIAFPNFTSAGYIDGFGQLGLLLFVFAGGLLASEVNFYSNTREEKGQEASPLDEVTKEAPEVPQGRDGTITSAEVRE